MSMLLAGALVLPLSALCAVDSVQFPNTFRRRVHAGTGVILPGANPQLSTEEGLHHNFANQKAAAHGN
jgi:hypothetical protein